MSMFRRMLMSSIDGATVYIANFTLKRNSDKDQYITSADDDNLVVELGLPSNKGIGFILYTDTTSNYKMNVTFKSQEKGEIVEHYVHKDAGLAGTSYKIFICDITSGLYDVELTIKPEEPCKFYLTDISGVYMPGASSKDSSRYYYCYCLYSINKLKPDSSNVNEGIKNNLTEYSDDLEFIQ